MNQHNISNESLVLSMVLVIIAILISHKEKLALEKDIIWSICRAVVQLIIVGYVLKYIFDVNNAILTVLMVLFICFNAAYNAGDPDFRHGGRQCDGGSWPVLQQPGAAFQKRSAEDSGDAEPGRLAEVCFGGADPRQYPCFVDPYGGLCQNRGVGQPAGHDVGSDLRRYRSGQSD